MNAPQRLKIIHDGDHGSDDFIATMIFARAAARFDLLGVTTGFGNTGVANAARNAAAALRLAGRDDVPVFRGSAEPLGMAALPGDDAFGANGIGGVVFSAGRAAEDIDAVAWMAQCLDNAPSPVTIAATGLMTNIARLLRDHPGSRGKITRIVAMGGCLGPLGPQGRHGNITPFAEFNFQQDPAAADAVLNCGLPVVLLPMDATHQTVLTPERQAMMRARLPGATTEKLIAMMRAAEHLDIPKFATTGPVLHDENVPLYLLRPDLYRGRQMRLSVNIDAADPQLGRLAIADSGNGPVLVIDTIADPDAVFAALLDALSPM